MTDYTNGSQQMLVRVVDALAADILTPKSLNSLATALEATRDQTFRTLKNLEQAGWAEQVGDAWRLTPRLTNISERLRLAISDIHQRYLTDD